MRRGDHKKRNIVLVILLAVLCLAGAELAACRYFDPELYHVLTAPVRRAGESVLELGRSAAHAAGRKWDEWSSQRQARREEKEREREREEEELETQLAGDPAIENDAPISDPAVTELKVVGGREALTGGVVTTVYFNQGEEPWASQPYGSDQIGGYGCGPTAMAMAVSSLTGQVVDPVSMAQWAVDNGHWARKSGSYLSIVEGAAAAWGLQAESMTERTPEDLRGALLTGRLLVALMGPGHFTQGGHFILLRGVTLSGDILVADPNSRERSLTAWDAQLLLDELSTHSSSGGPLWAVCVPAE